MTDSLPPHSEAAERGFTGAAIQYAETFDLADAEGFTPAWLFEERHRCIYETARALAEAGNPVSPATVVERLRVAGNLDAVGGVAFLSSLVDEAPTAGVAGYWLKELRDTYRRRRLVANYFEIAKAAHEARTTEQVEAAVALAESLTLGAGDGGPRREVDGAGLATLARGNALARINGSLHGVPTGLRNLDRLLTGGGLHSGQVVVIAGRPSTGKSALALSIALNIAGGGKPVGFVSLEMSAGELADRSFATLSRVNVGALHPDSRPSQADLARMKAAGERMRELPLVVDDAPGRSVASIRSLARRWKRTHRIEVLVIDYLQLVEGDRTRTKDRREAVDAVSRGLKVCAKELGIPVIALAQLNREFEKETARKPRLSDLRESGAIEQDADVVGMLYQPPTPDGEPEPREDEGREIRLLLAKQRNGPRGVDVRLFFDPSLTAFSDLKPAIDHDAR